MKPCNVNALSNAQLATLLPHLDLIESWCAAIRARALDELESGREIPGYKLVAGRKGIRQWTDETQAAHVLCTYLQDPYEHRLLSPAAAEKRLPKDQHSVLAALVTQSEGRPTLALASDKRPALAVFD